MVFHFFSLKLTPVERYAMRFMEISEECWSAEQLRAAEAQIEEQKKAWELKRMASLSCNDDELVDHPSQFAAKMSSEPEGGLLTFAHQDSVNQVNKKPGRPRSKTSLIQSDSTTCNSSLVKRRGRPRKRGRSSPNCNVSFEGKREGKEEESEFCSGRSSRPSSSAATFQSHYASQSPDTEQTPRKRTRSALRSETSISIDGLDSLDACAGSAQANVSGNSSDSHSPRTRSRGTVNINLWTLDVKPLLPAAKTQLASPNSKVVSSKSKEVSSTSSDDKANSSGDSLLPDSSSPAPSSGLVNGVCDLQTAEYDTPLKKIKLVDSTDPTEGGEQDLDVVG